MGISKRSRSPPQVTIDGFDAFADAELAHSSDEEGEQIQDEAHDLPYSDAAVMLVKGQVSIRKYFAKQEQTMSEADDAEAAQAVDEVEASVEDFDIDEQVECLEQADNNAFIANEEAAIAMGLRLDLESDSEDDANEEGLDVTVASVAEHEVSELDDEDAPVGEACPATPKRSPPLSTIALESSSPPRLKRARVLAETTDGVDAASKKLDPPAKARRLHAVAADAVMVQP